MLRHLRVLLASSLFIINGCKTIQNEKELSTLQSGTSLSAPETNIFNKSFEQSFCSSTNDFNLYNAYWLTAMANNQYTHFGYLAEWMQRLGFGNKSDVRYWHRAMFYLDFLSAMEEHLVKNKSLFSRMFGSDTDLRNVDIVTEDVNEIFGLIFFNNLGAVGLMDGETIEDHPARKPAKGETGLSPISQRVQRLLSPSFPKENILPWFSSIRAEFDLGDFVDSSWNDDEKLLGYLRVLRTRILTLRAEVTDKVGANTFTFSKAKLSQLLLRRQKYFAPAVEDHFRDLKRLFKERLTLIQKGEILNKTQGIAKVMKHMHLTGAPDNPRILPEYKKLFTIKNAASYKLSLLRLPDRRLKIQFFSGMDEESKSNSTQVFFAQHSTLPLAVISFRGTSSLIDAAVDLRAFKEEYHQTKKQNWGKVHQGFNRALNEVKLESIVARLDMIKEVPVEGHGPQKVQLWVTGHSLGGALSTLQTSYLLHHINIRDLLGQRDTLTWFLRGLYNIGSPRVGNEQYYTQFKSEARKRNLGLHRIVNGNDTVTRIPKIFYYHIGNVAVLSEGKDKAAHKKLMEGGSCRKEVDVGTYRVTKLFGGLDHMGAEYQTGLIKNIELFEALRKDSRLSPGEQQRLSNYLECNTPQEMRWIVPKRSQSHINPAPGTRSDIYKYEAFYNEQIESLEAGSGVESNCGLLDIYRKVN